jgi:hypothetical protein
MLTVAHSKGYRLSRQHGKSGFELGQYNTKYKYNFKMKSHGINHGHLMWCEENIKNGYGWWFKREAPYVTQPHEDDRAYVSFKTKEDHAKFTWYMLKQNED